MIVTEKQLQSLQDIQKRVTGLMYDYARPDPDFTPSVEEGLSDLAEQLNRLVSIIIENASVDPGELTSEDYEAIYGWGGQG